MPVLDVCPRVARRLMTRGMLATMALSPLMVALLSQAALAQCRVEGTVRSADGTPIAGATVRILGPDLRSPLAATTGADGRYAVDNIKPGIRVEVVAFQSGRTVARGFTLVTLFVETVDLRAQPESSTSMGDEELDPGKGPSGEIRGVVQTAAGASVAGARVAISQTMVATNTDAAGRFALAGLRSGLHLELDVSASGFRPATAEVVVPTDDSVDANVVLDAARGPGTDLETAAVLDHPSDGSSLVLRPDDVVRVPSLGQRDIFRALQFLPGATGGLEASSDLYVRGGAPDQTLIIFDGFTIYPFTHTFGVLSAVNMDAVERADFSESAVDAADGGRLAGVLRLTGASNPSGKPTASVDLSVLGWAARVSAPLGDRGAFLIAARRSPPTTLYDDVLDRFAGGSTVSARDAVPRFSGGLFGASPASSFYDVNSKIDLKLSPKDRVSVTVYDGRDTANTSHDIPTPPDSDVAVPSGLSLPADTLAQISDVETWNGRGVSAHWERGWSPSIRTTVSVGHSEFSKSRDASSLLTSPSTGVDYSFAAGRGGSAALVETNDIRDTTVRLANSFRLGFEHVVSVGAEVTSLDASYNALTEVFQRPGAASLFTSSLVTLLDQKGTGHQATAFAQDAWRPFGRLTLSPGARLTHYDLAGVTYVDPRVSAGYRLGNRVQLTGAWTVDHQVANRITREDLTRGDGEFWALADGSIVPVARARQAAGGVAVELRDFLGSAHVYYKTIDNLAMFAPRLYPGVAPDGSSLMHHGSGRALGLELLAQATAGWNMLWTSYDLARADYTFPTLQAAAFPASYDQRHELKVTDVARLGRSWSISGVWVFGSGRPDTPEQGVVPVWFPSGNTVNEIAFGPKNSGRLPPYHRLDLSTQRELRFRALAATLGVTLFNVYDRQNVWYREYETAGTALTVTNVTLMRRAVDAFLRFGF
jgi:hypothetical protein